MGLPPEAMLALLSGALLVIVSTAAAFASQALGASQDQAFAWALASVPLPGAVIAYLGHRWRPVPDRYRLRLTWSPLIFVGVAVWQIPDLTPVPQPAARAAHAGALALGAAYLLVVLRRREGGSAAG